MEKKVFSVIIVLLLAAFSITVWSDTNPVRSYTKSIKLGKETRTAKVVEVNLNNKGISLEVVTAQDKLGKTEKLSDMVKRKKPAAAINANFFNAYSDMEPLGTIVKNGRPVFLGNTGTTVGITADNKLKFGSPKTTILGALDGKYKNEYLNNQMVWNAWSAWYLNDIGVADTSVAIYTPDRGEKISLKPGMAVVVENGTVADIVETPKEVSIPKEGYVIYYGTKADKDYKAYVNNRFRIGRAVEYELFVKNNEDSFQWDELNYALTAGPRLIKDGTIEVNPQKEGFHDPRIAVNQGQRSALGVTKDNKLILATVPNVNVNELAVIMKSLGCINALNLDGGASSGLYCNGKMLTSPGRELSTVLMVYQK